VAGRCPAFWHPSGVGKICLSAYRGYRRCASQPPANVWQPFRPAPGMTVPPYDCPRPPTHVRHQFSGNPPGCAADERSSPAFDKGCSPHSFLGKHLLSSQNRQEHDRLSATTKRRFGALNLVGRNVGHWRHCDKRWFWLFKSVPVRSWRDW